uniref:Tc3 transposase DNA binding domain-containing protein n=1 Tax=Glossina austeni TaxID=7395 RepID=A0A1A9VGS7_GLOAU
MNSKYSGKYPRSPPRFIYFVKKLMLKVPHGSELSEEECWKIEGTRLAGKKIDEISVAINRKTQSKDVDNYGCIKGSGRVPTVHQKMKRHICHLATNENMSFRQIREKLGLNITRCAETS